MSDREEGAGGKRPPRELDPEMRRGVSRRSLLTDELGRTGMQMMKRLPGLAPLLGIALRESPAQRDERLVTNLWQLLVGRAPKENERAAGLEVVRNAQTPEEKGDALVDILWALCRTQEYEDLQRPVPVLIRGLYRIALDRDPNDEEREAALRIIAEAEEHALHAVSQPVEGVEGVEGEEPPPDASPEQAQAAARAGALEGLFTGLIRSYESVLRREPSR